MSILDTVSHFIDSYLRAFRLLPWLLAGSGVLLVYRHSRGPMRRFFKATDVPQSCIESHVPLRGVVVRVCTDSVAVWHVPVWSRWFKPPSPSSGMYIILYLVFKVTNVIKVIQFLPVLL